MAPAGAAAITEAIRAAGLDKPAAATPGIPGDTGTIVSTPLSVCTHAGGAVEWDAPDAVLYCPCHGAAFDPANEGAVLQGPTDQPLAALPIVVDRASGTIRLRA